MYHHTALHKIHVQWSCNEVLTFGSCSHPIGMQKLHIDTSQYLFHIVGLGNIVVGAQVERTHFLWFVTFDRNNDDWQKWIGLTKLLTHMQATYIR